MFCPCLFAAASAAAADTASILNPVSHHNCRHPAAEQEGVSNPGDEFVSSSGDEPVSSSYGRRLADLARQRVGSLTSRMESG